MVALSLVHVVVPGVAAASWALLCPAWTCQAMLLVPQSLMMHWSMQLGGHCPRALGGLGLRMVGPAIAAAVALSLVAAAANNDQG
jgi:hypothetical protein